MEPFQATMTMPVLIGLMLATMTLFVIIVMMGVGIYKEK